MDLSNSGITDTSNKNWNCYLCNIFCTGNHSFVPQEDAASSDPRHTGFPYNQEILTALVVISFATLVLSGGIIEALRLFGFAAELSPEPHDVTYSFWDDHSLIGDILDIILILLSFVVVAAIIACVPTVFIIAHNIRKHHNT